MHSFLAGSVAGLLLAVVPAWAYIRHLAGLLASAAQETAVSAQRERELQADCRRLDAELAAARTRLEADAEASAGKLAALRATRDDIAQQLKALCHEALQTSSVQLVQLAAERLGAERSEGLRDLDQERNSLSELLAPVAETLHRFDSRLESLDRERTRGQAELRSQITALADAQGELRAGADALAGALSRPAVRGRWGELTLRRVVELAGLARGIEFTEQPTLSTPDGQLRPDLVVHLGGDKTVAVDAKVPMAEYLAACSATDEPTRRAHLAGHARQLRAHLTKLAERGYAAALPNSPDQVICFIPHDGLWSAALEADPSLMDEIVATRVAVATPLTLLVLLRMIAWTLRQQQVSREAEEVSKLGRDLHARLALLTKRLDVVGRRLNSTTSAFNEAVGCFEGRVLVSARRFAQLGVVAVDANGADLATPQQVLNTPRLLVTDDAEEQNPGNDQHDVPGEQVA